MTTNFLGRGRQRYTLELAITNVTVLNGGDTEMWGLLTVMDLSLGVLTDAMFYVNDSDDYGLPSVLNTLDLLSLDAEEDEGHLVTVSLPDATVLPDWEAFRLRPADGTTFIRRQYGEPVHPAHQVARDVLLWTSGPTTPDVEEIEDAWEDRFAEVGTHSVYEHTFAMGPVFGGAKAVCQVPGSVDTGNCR